MLAAASQKDPVDNPAQLGLVPHTQAPDWHTSLGLLQAATVAEHLHVLAAESQYEPVGCPAQLAPLPHMQLPNWHDSLGLVQAPTILEHLH